jgi:hypothetical protein
MSRQRRDVFAPFAQRRDLDGDDVEREIQVGTDASGGDGAGQR